MDKESAREEIRRDFFFGEWGGFDQAILLSSRAASAKVAILINSIRPTHHPRGCPPQLHLVLSFLLQSTGCHDHQREKGMGSSQ